MIELSIIIVSFKNIEIVLECIDSISKYNDIGSQLEVILIDNSPNHEVYEATITKYTHIVAVKNENKGFGAGNNVGASLAKGKYLLFLNPDTILVEPIFKFAIDKFDSNKSIGMFGVMLINDQLKRNASFYLCSGGGLLRSLIIKMCNKLDFYIDGLMYVAGADMFVRHQDFNDCGKFDENIFMYYEEPDLTFRIRKIGKKTAYYKNKKIIHLEGGTTPDSNIALRRRLDSAIYYFTKHKMNAKKALKRELRLNLVKLFIYRLFKNKNKIESTILILKEYINKIPRQ